MRVLALLAALLLLHPAGLAATPAEAIVERAGLSRLAALSRELKGPDVRALAEEVLSGELPFEGAAERVLPALAHQARRAILSALSVLALPVLATLMLRLALGRADGPLTLLCRLACALGLARQCRSATQVAEGALRAAAKLAGGASPVVAAVLSLTGRPAAAGALTPLTALCAGIIQTALIEYGLPLCAVAAALAAGGSLSDRFRLDRLFRLVCKAVTWGLRAAVAGFMALLALQGRLTAARDGVSARVVQRALKGLIPYVGGALSDSSGVLAQAALSARNAVGVTGMLVALGVCAGPAARLGAHMLSLKLASALIEPVADPGVSRIAAAYGEVARLLLAFCAAGGLLSALLLGTGLGLLGF